MTAVVDNIPICESNEIRPKNVIEKDVQSATKPFDFMQALYVLSKYRIRNDIITPNSLLYNIISGIWSLVLVVGYFLSIFKNIFTVRLEGYNFVKCFCNSLIFTVYFFGNVINYCNNVIQRHQNVLLALKIQDVYEMYKTNETSLKNFTMSNWIYVIFLICFKFFWIIYFDYAFNSVYQFYEIITDVVNIIFDINTLYPGRLIKFILEPLKVWVDDVRKSDCVVDSENEYYWNRKFRVYMEIVEAYEIIGKTFQPLILYYCIDTFINGVIAILIRVEFAKFMGGSMLKVAVSFISLTWMFKNIALITVLCLECERFYSVMEEVQSTCIQFATSRRCSETQKRVCKNIERVYTSSFKKMSACRLFDIDAELILSFLGLLTTYIIVVLQFEFL